MKTKILLLLIGLCCANVIQAQEVFPTSDAIWNIQINGIEHYYGLSGDTVFNNTLYNKLYLLNDTTLNIGEEDEYIGCFRQEDKRVWFRPNGYSPYYSDESPSGETLLYDFSKNINDTIWHNLLIQGGWTYMAENITASIVDNVNDIEGVKIYQTTQYIHNGELIPMMGRTDICMEGIGSIDCGLFYFLDYPSMGGGTSYHLACFKRGDEVKYMDNPTCNSCFCYSTSGISENKSNPVTVWQENNYIKITGAAFIYPCKLKLFDTMGRVRINKIIASDNDPGLITDKLKGIFLYQLLKDNEIIKTGKIMIK